VSLGRELVGESGSGSLMAGCATNYSGKRWLRLAGSGCGGASSSSRTSVSAQRTAVRPPPSPGLITRVRPNGPSPGDPLNLRLLEAGADPGGLRGGPDSWPDTSSSPGSRDFKPGGAEDLIEPSASAARATAQSAGTQNLDSPATRSLRPTAAAARRSLSDRLVQLPISRHPQVDPASQPPGVRSM